MNCLTILFYLGLQLRTSYSKKWTINADFIHLSFQGVRTGDLFKVK
jgi:hypothetical protein